jgi:hypothetical protein
MISAHSRMTVLASFIEVKTTRGPGGTAFYVTANELKCSKMHQNDYCLYRLFEFGRAPRLFRLRGSLSRFLDLEPRVYSARCSVKHMRSVKAS